MQGLCCTMRVEFPSHLRGVPVTGNEFGGGTSRRRTKMRFGISGPVLVDDGEAVVAVPGGRQQVLLAVDLQVQVVVADLD